MIRRKRFSRTAVLIVLFVTGCMVFDAPVRAQEETVVYTNDDLSDAPATVPEPGTPSQTLSINEEHRDRNGCGKGWWRQRAAELDIRIAVAAYEAQKLHVAYLKTQSLVDPTLPKRSREATAYLRELEAERDRLPEEMRVAGGLPGWLRRGELYFPEELLPPPVPGEPVYADTVTFSWKTVSGARFYIVEVECTNSTRMIDDIDALSLDVSVTNAKFRFETGCTGQWRVRALDPAGYSGEWSSWSGFEYLSLPKSISGE